MRAICRSLWWGVGWPSLYRQSTQQTSSAPTHLSSDVKPTKPDDLLEAYYSCLERLEDDLRHADLGIEERCKLEERVLRLRRKLSL